MAGSIYGNNFKISTWGESHGKAIGVVIDGCPSGMALTVEDIQVFLDRRSPGSNAYTTTRSEEDQVVILSGLFKGFTTGMPISLLVWNRDQHTRDYANLSEVYRPGHGDYTYDAKYGHRDFRGGGRSSGRETIGRVAAGAIAAKALSNLGISLLTYTKSIGSITVDESEYDFSQIDKNPLSMPHDKKAANATKFLDSCIEAKDSAGGVIECSVKGMPAGIGSPVFDKLDALLAKAVLSIGGVKGVEFGEGFHAASLYGSENNDSFTLQDGHITTKTNHSGGILGGISNGNQILLRAAFKPTPSIARAQKTIDKDGNPVTLTIKGRHDPIIVPRAIVVVESMVALTLLDCLMEQTHTRLDYLKQILLNGGE